MNNFYETIKERYAAATPEIKKASRDHWINVHKKNIASGREDLIIFSSQVLAAYDIIDN